MRERGETEREREMGGGERKRERSGDLLQNFYD
jgi:hypothetical protein